MYIYPSEFYHNYKLSFKDKKVSQFNNKVVTVKLSGEIQVPSNKDNDCFYFPASALKFFIDKKNPSYICEGTLRFTVIGKAVLSEEDTFDFKKGERIAETRARIIAYKAYAKFLQKVFEYQRDLSKRTEEAIGISDAILEREQDYLKKLLEDAGQSR